MQGSGSYNFNGENLLDGSYKDVLFEAICDKES